MSRRWLALPVLFVAATAWGAIYKWVDASGVTHYSETPPAQGEAREMRVGGEAQPAPAPAEAARPLPAERAAPSAQPGNGAAPAPEVDAAKQEADAARRMDECMQARDNLRLLEGPGTVYRFDAQGERVPLGGAERPAAIEQARKALEGSCKTE